MSRRDADYQSRDWAVIRPWRELVRSTDVEEMIDIVRRYGWLPALFGFTLHALARGVFEYFSDPFVVTEGYVFAGWPFAVLINLVFGAAVVAFSWFLYFGLVGVIAGFLSDEYDMVTDVFKFGGYLTVLFTPVFLVGTLVIATVTAPEAGADAVAENGEDAAEFAMRSYSFVYETPQMHAVRVFKALTWITIGFLMLPVVQRLYDIDEKRSVVSVLPVTLAGVIAAFLL